MSQFYLIFGKAVGFFFLGVTLASIFIWCIIQGAITHLGGSTSPAMIYYFVGWLSGVAALALYLQAKYLFHYAKISKD